MVLIATCALLTARHSTLAGGSKYSKRFNSTYLTKIFPVEVEIGMAAKVEVKL